MRLSDIGDTESDKETLKLITLEYDVITSGVIVPEPEITLYCRDEDGRRREIIVEGFYPYFYVTDEEFEEKIDNIQNDRKTRETKRRCTKSLKNEEVLSKIYTKKPEQVADMREDFDRTWEADVFFTNRFLIDSGIKTTFEIPEGEDRVHTNQIEPTDESLDISPRIIYVDIEVLSGGEMPEPKHARKPINAITAYDSYDNEYITWVLESEEWEDEPEFGDNVYLYEDERNMLEDFNSWIGRREIDILTGWNSSQNDIGKGFDYPYILSRCSKLNLYSTNNWSPEDMAFTGEYGSAIIGGVELIDMMQAYEKTQVHELEERSLDFVANKELGFGKEDIGDLDEGYYNQPEKFVEYNRRDVEAVVEIDKSAEVIDLYESLRDVTGAKFDDCHNNIDMIDVFFLRKARERNIALPTSEEPDENWYHGGFVFNPTPGKHENILYPDLACFTEGHEVLTPEGIRKIEDLERGDKIYTLDEDTHNVVIDEVESTHNYYYNGAIHKNTSKSINYEITPNHNIYTHDGGEEKPENFSKKQVYGSKDYYRKLPSSNGIFNGEMPDTIDITDDVENIDAVLYYEGDGRTKRYELPEEVQNFTELHKGSEEKYDSDLSQNRMKKFHIPISKFRKYEDSIRENFDNIEYKSDVRCRIKDTEYNTENLLKILAWYITEGNVELEHCISISNEDKQVLHEISETLDDMNINHHVGESSISFNHGVMRKWLVQKSGENSFEKRIPELVFGMPIETRRWFLEEMIRGDGYTEDSGRKTYYTASESLRDDFCRLALSVGENPRVFERDRSEHEYDIILNNKAGSIKRKKNEEINQHDGQVYCVTAKENHVIYAGKNGKMNWIGQSLYPYIMKTLNISPDTIIGTEEELEKSEYTKEDCLTAYIDSREVAESNTKEDIPKYRGNGYKAVYSPKKNDALWADDPQFDKIYYLKPEVKEGFVTSILDELVDLKYQYTGKTYEAVKRVTNCFTEDTEVMTENGLEKIRELEVGDRVYSYNKEIDEIEIKKVAKTWDYPEYDGELISIENEDVDFKVTPNHNMLVKDSGDYEFIEAQNLEEKKYKLPVRNSEIDVEKDVEYLDNSEGVYCVTVEDNHSLLAGRNGKLNFVGQSQYGVMGDSSSYNKGFRLFDTRLAEAVTLAGQKVLQFTGEKFVESIKNQGYEDAYLAYGDSDSVITSMPSAESTTEALLAGKQASEYTKQKYDGFMKKEFDVDEHLMDVEIESYASGIFFSRKSDDLENAEEAAKKRYAQLIEWDEDEGFFGYIENPEPNIKGFDYVRSDTSQLTKEVQKEVLRIILEEDDPKKEVYDYLEQKIEEVRNGDYIEEIGKPKSISKDLSKYGTENRSCTPRIRGSKYATKHIDGVNIDSGASPKTYRVENVPKDYPQTYDADTAEDGDPVDAIALEDVNNIPDDFELDYDTMLDKTLKSSLEPILRTMEWSWADVKGKGRQKGLESF